MDMKYITDNKDIITIWIAIIGCLTATIASIATATTGIVNVVNMKRQRLHYRKSLRPIASITMGDYENLLRVTLRNDGPGPMIISDIEILQSETREKVGSALIALMPTGITWTTFVNDIRERAFASGKDIELLEVSEGNNKNSWPQVREGVRSALAKLSVKVAYRSAYDEPFMICRSLDWFGREKQGG